MYRGTKFNSKKEDVVGDTYLGIKKYRFIMKCTGCNADYSIVTDPKGGDYAVEHGVTRNFEHWVASKQAREEAEKEREDEELGNA